MRNTITLGEMLDDPEAAYLERRLGQLAALEKVIEEGLPRFVEVGKALLEIREHALYTLSGHKTFEEYVAVRWEFTAGRARQLIAGARAVTSGNAEGALTERQARVMARRARRSDAVALHEEMHEFVAAQPDWVERAQDVPEGVRISRVQPPLSPLLTHDRAAVREFVQRLERVALNEREHAYLLAALEMVEASIAESTRAARKALKEARRRGTADPARRNDGRQWNPPSLDAAT